MAQPLQALKLALQPWFLLPFLLFSLLVGLGHCQHHFVILRLSRDHQDHHLRPRLLPLGFLMDQSRRQNQVCLLLAIL